MRDRQGRPSRGPTPPGRTILLGEQAEDSIRACVHGQTTEIGGILAGAASEDGRFLVVTHATGPGPNALRERHMFRSDEDHQRRCLGRLQEVHGVRLLGEWHLHPGNLDRPSGWDERELVALLTDRQNPRGFGYVVGIATVTESQGFRLNLFFAAVVDEELSIEPVERIAIPLFLDVERAFPVRKDDGESTKTLGTFG